MNTNTSLKECLHKYDMESLQAYCAEYDAPFSENDKDAVCIALSDALCAQHVLEKRLGILDDAALAGLHSLIDGTQIDDEDVLDHLDGLDLIYGSSAEHLWEVPQEVIAALSIENDAWNLERKSRVWLMECLTIVQHYWADVTVDVMRQLYQKNTDVDAEADLQELFQEIPASEIPCVLIGDSFVIRGWRTSEVFAGYREKQKKYSYYIPELEEVIDLYQNDFDTRSSYGKAVKEWFLHNGAEEDDLELLLHEMWNDMNYGHAETEIIQEAESMIVFDSKNEQESFRQMIHDWYTHVRRMDMRGHAVKEMN